MGYYLFVLVNAALFIRPSEIIPGLEAIPIYNILISSCLLISYAEVQRELTLPFLVATPITVCVLGMDAAVVLSHLTHNNLTYAKDAGFGFLKVVLYYLLVAALLSSPARLRRFLRCLCIMIGIITLLSLLHYHGVMTIANMKVEDRTEINSATGEVYTVKQLYGTGIFSDPNDLCLILAMGIALSFYEFDDRRSSGRWFWLVPMAAFAYTLFLTKSRGGFLAMLACVLSVFVGRFGWKRTIPIAAVILPLMMVLFAGRQTDLSTSSGTGQQRIQLWAESLALFRRVPLFGLGSDLLPDEIGHEAHNSYVQSYAELGLFGATAFLGMYACAFWGLRRLGLDPERIRDPELRRIRPYLLGILAGYAMGMFTLTRNYINVTYLVPGLIAAYLRLAAADADSSLLLPRFDARLVRRLIGTSTIVLGLLYIYVRVFARFG